MHEWECLRLQVEKTASYSTYHLSTPNKTVLDRTKNIGDSFFIYSYKNPEEFHYESRDKWSRIKGKRFIRKKVGQLALKTQKAEANRALSITSAVQKSH